MRLKTISKNLEFQSAIKSLTMFPWTFILQFMILTFNATFLVHMIDVDVLENSITNEGTVEEFLKMFWELLLISVLSIATTLRKFTDFLYKHKMDEKLGLDRKLSKITKLVMMAMLTSLVADIHYIPALVVAIRISDVSLSLLGGIVLLLILVVFIGLEKYTRLEKEKGHINIQVIIFSVILLIILGFVGSLSLGLDEKKDLIIAMTVGALIANTFGTIFVIWENKLEGEKNEEMVKPCWYLFSWNDVPGNDKYRLIDYLVKDLRIDWAKNATIKKDDKTIIVTKDENSLELELNEKENKVILKISNEETYTYNVKNIIVVNN